MKLILFGGFLGSGKTTVMMSLASFLIKHSKSEKISLAIIENEIGKQGVDQNVAGSGGLNVKTLLSGCICCTLASDLVDAISEIHEKYSPEYLLIEATGLAIPSNIMETINKYSNIAEKTSVLVLADYERWTILSRAMPELMKSQIEGANYIILNKADKVTGEKAEKILDDIKSCAKDATIYSVCAKNGINDEIWHEVLI